MDDSVAPTTAPDTEDRSLSHEPRGKWGLVAAGILATGIVGFILLQVLASEPVQVARDSRAPLVEVIALDLQTGPLPVRGNGPVRPRAQVIVIAQVSGEITETGPALVTGGRFKAGDSLLQIDPRSYRAALDQAKADRSARQADLDFAERQLERDQKLTKSGAASERRRDETLNQRDRARAQIAGLDALIAMRAIDLERTNVVAPFDGQVFSESVDVGSIVQPGAEIARIFATDIFEIVVPFTDAEASLIPGLWDDTLTTRPRATATLLYRGDVYAWDGSVDRVEAGIDPDTRTIDVVVRIPNPTRRGQIVGDENADSVIDPPPFLSGTYAGIEIEGLNLTYALVPRSALRNDDTLWLVKDDNTLEVVAVDVVQDQDTFIAVRSSSLKDGGRLVVSDLGYATAGLEVQVLVEDDSGQ